MKGNSDYSRWNLALSVSFLILGLIFNPFIMPILFRSKIGDSLSGKSFVFVVIFDIIVIGLSFFFYKIKSSPLSYFLKKHWREFLTCGCSLILCLVIAEVVLRFWVLHYASDTIKNDTLTYKELTPEQRRIEPALYLNYGLNSSYILNGQKQHNSFGYRGPEFTIPKPAHTFRIVCMGGSTTYTGKVPDWTQAYPAQLEAILKNVYGYENVEVINAGVPGYCSWETLMNFSFRVLDTDPDLIIIYHAVNDVNARIVTPTAYRGDNTGWRRSWSTPELPLIKKSMILRLINLQCKLYIIPKGGISGAVEASTSLIGQLRQEQLVKVLQANSPVYFERNLRNIIAIAKDRQISVVLSTFAYVPDGPAQLPFFQAIDQHNQIIRDLSDKYDLPLIDFKSIMSQDTQYWADTVHVNETGAHLKAEHFAEFLHTHSLIPILTGDKHEQVVNY